MELVFGDENAVGFSCTALNLISDFYHVKAAGAVGVAAGAVAGTATSWERGSWSLGESGPRHRVPCSRRGVERHKCRIS